MKKIGFGKRLLKGIGKGIIDSFPIIATIKNNVSDNHTTDDKGVPVGQGNVDWIRLLVNISIVGLIAAFVFGKITMEDLKILLKYLGVNV